MLPHIGVPLVGFELNSSAGYADGAWDNLSASPDRRHSRCIMSLKLACPHCDARLVWKKESAPGEITCPKCRRKFRPQAHGPHNSAPDDSTLSGTTLGADGSETEEYAIRKADPLPGNEPDFSAVGRVVTTGATSGSGQVKQPVGTETAAAPRKASSRTKQSTDPARTGDKPIWEAGGSSADLMRAVVEAFRGQTVHRPPTLGYRLALLFSAGMLCVLIAAYIACLAGFAYLLYLYAVHFVPNSFQVRGRGVVLVILMHIGVAVAGLGILYAMIAPLFRWERDDSEPVVLSAVEHPVLHCFVRALCDLIKAPQPDEIRLIPIPNASAGRQGGFFGIIGGRLVLQIGEPLFYGCDLRTLAGVIAHELGHFSQSAGGWLLRYIGKVTNWFQEATIRTMDLQENIQQQEFEGQAQAIIWVAWITTGFGRLILMLFALLSRLIAFNLMRQQEFDADRYEAQVAGSGQFARTFERLCELQVGFEIALMTLMRGEMLADTGLGFGGQVVYQADELSDRDRRRVSKLMSPQKSQWFDSHPSPSERIAAVARNPQPGIFQLAGPAISLLNVNRLMRKLAAHG
jgi:Zn-dependent protease with chaperone function